MPVPKRMGSAIAPCCRVDVTIARCSWCVSAASWFDDTGRPSCHARPTTPSPRARVAVARYSSRTGSRSGSATQVRVGLIVRPSASSVHRMPTVKSSRLPISCSSCGTASPSVTAPARTRVTSYWISARRRAAAVTARARSFERHSAMLATPEARMKPAWMAARPIGLPSWPKARTGATAPMIAWWTKTKATPSPYGSQSSYMATMLIVTKKWKCASVAPCAAWTVMADAVSRPSATDAACRRVLRPRLLATANAAIGPACATSCRKSWPSAIMEKSGTASTCSHSTRRRRAWRSANLPAGRVRPWGSFSRQAARSRRANEDAHARRGT